LGVLAQYTATKRRYAEQERLAQAKKPKQRERQLQSAKIGKYILC
jgi:hypothetical protein